jgi:hypothetical protein
VAGDGVGKGEYSSEDEKMAWEGTIADLLAQRKDIRRRIAEEFPYKATVEGTN